MRFTRLSLLFFFFQAEDGIRDDLVTGVQTCALPISNSGREGRSIVPSSPRSSTAAKPFCSAKSRILSQLHVGHPKVEKQIGKRPLAARANSGSIAKKMARRSRKSRLAQGVADIGVSGTTSINFEGRSL